ncbi:acyl-CoA dehydrogenase family protein [Planotetraspora sp. GP83]|uniref:acyl-CoA dehydrogenase family protein n=1 Tax=Planotetraspora sp. GP83 TaxID=3156264 RepID=UPI0035132C59
MDFELNEDQRLFQRTLREFVERDIVPVVSEWERAGRYPAEIVERFRQLGLFGITVPERYGGLDLDRVSFALVFEEIARGWMGVAGILGSHSPATWMIAERSGSSWPTWRRRSRPPG